LPLAVEGLHVPSPEDFEKELAFFEKLHASIRRAQPSHLLPLQLTYKRGGDFFLIFPWADGNLKAFWKEKRADPSSPQDVRWFLSQCAGIALGLRRIHYLSTFEKRVTVPVLDDGNALVLDQLNQLQRTRHCDINPENNLWFREYYTGNSPSLKDYMVIDDFSQTRFIAFHYRPQARAQDQDVPATYGAPVLHTHAVSSPRSDVWSLGCVLLEFTSWFVYGYDKGINAFTDSRLFDVLESEMLREDKFFSLWQRTSETKKSAVLKRFRD
jgi:serine/threonine protein kinase